MVEIDTIPTLDRESFVPLYYQLQEILKERIESGEWAPGDALPPELQLARLYGVSRVCVRQALAILEDDREIERVQGRGTFVAQRKLTHRPTGLVGLRTAAAPARVSVRVLDRQLGGADRVISTALGRPSAEILRITALWLMQGNPFAIGQHFFAADATPWPESALSPGHDLTPSVADGLTVTSSALSVESTQCGQFEADLLGIPNRATLLLTVAVITAGYGDDLRPSEFVRLGYRGDIVQLTIDAR